MGRLIFGAGKGYTRCQSGHGYVFSLISLMPTDVRHGAVDNANEPPGILVHPGITAPAPTRTTTPTITTAATPVHPVLIYNNLHVARADLVPQRPAHQAHDLRPHLGHVAQPALLCVPVRLVEYDVREGCEGQSVL